MFETYNFFSFFIIFQKNDFVKSYPAWKFPAKKAGCSIISRPNSRKREFVYAEQRFWTGAWKFIPNRRFWTVSNRNIRKISILIFVAVSGGMENMMFLDFSQYEEFVISVDRLSELSYLYRLVLDSDTAFPENNRQILYDVLYSFSEGFCQISDTLNLIQEQLVRSVDEKGRAPEKESVCNPSLKSWWYIWYRVNFPFAEYEVFLCDFDIF